MSLRTGRRLAVALAAVAALGAATEWAVRRASMEGRRAEVERALSAALGREVRFGSAFHLELLPRPRLEATDVTLANGPGRPSPHLLAIDTLRLEIALWPLLRRRLEIEGLAIDGADLRLEPGEDGRIDALPPLGPLAGGASAPGSGLSLQLDHLELRDVRVAKSDPASGAVATLWLDAVEISADRDDEPIGWSARGELQGGGFDLAGSGGTLRALLHPEGPWPLSFEGQIGEAEVRVSGRVAEPLRLAGLDLDLDIEMPELGRALGRAGAVPPLGGARLRAHLVDPGGEHGLERISLESAEGAEIGLRVQGSVQRLAGPSGIELDVEVEVDRLQALEAALGRPLPEGSLQAKLRLRDADGTLGLDGDARLRARDGALSLDLEGSLGDLAGREGLDARLRLAARDLAALGRTASVSWPLPAVGPVAGSARVRGSGGAVAVEGLRLEAGRRGASWLLVEGSLGSLEPLSGVRLDASFGARSLAELGRELGLARVLPAAGPVDGRVRLRDPRGVLGLERFELRGGTTALLDFAFQGSLADLRQTDALEAQARVAARDLGVVGALFGVALPALGPARFEGRVRGSDERLDSEGSLQLGQSRLEGRWSAELAGRARPRLGAELRAPWLRLEDLGLARGGSEAEGPAFSWGERRPLPFDRLRLADARVSLQADRVTAGSDVDLRDARARLELEDGALQLRDLRLAYQGGQVAGGLGVDARAADPRVELRLEASALDLAGVAEVLGGSQADAGSGQLDLSLDLASRGASPAALRERLGGRLALALREWSAAGSWSRRFLMDLSRAFLGAGAGRRPDRVGCLVGALAFEAGVGTVEELVLSGPRATVIGRGRIDLGRERFDLEFAPEVHKPGLLSLAAAVRVTGPFDAPRFQPVPLDMVSSALGSIARAALRPAKLATTGARRVLGPAGRILSPVQGAIGFASGERPRSGPAACGLPPHPAAN